MKLVTATLRVLGDPADALDGGQHIGDVIVGTLQAPAHLSEGRGLAVPNRYHEVLPHEDVDLPELDLLGVVEVSGWPQDDEQSLSVALELWSLVGLQGVFDGQLVEFELLCD